MTLVIEYLITLRTAKNTAHFGPVLSLYSKNEGILVLDYSSFASPGDSVRSFPRLGYDGF